MTPEEFAKYQRDYLIQTDKRSAVQIIYEFEKLKRDINDYLTTNLLGKITVSKIAQQSLLERTLEEINYRLEKIRNPFTRIISQGQQKVVNFAANSLQKFLELKTSIFSPDKEALEKLKIRTNNLFDKLKPDVAELAKNELMTGFELGESHIQIASRLEKAANLGKWRALSIARTETNEAYRAASRDFYAEAQIKKYMWMSILDVRTCLICWHLHGQIFKTSVKVFSHPNCRCTLIPYIGQKVKTGAEIFADLEAGVQKEILGPKRFEFYRAGANLNNFVESSVLPNLQVSYSVKALSEFNEPAASGTFRAKGYFFINEQIFDYTPEGKVFGQSADYSCVAGAARMVLRDNGIDLPEAYLRVGLKTTEEGTPLSRVSLVLNEEVGEKYIFRRKLEFGELKSALEKGSAVVNVRAGNLVHSLVIDKIEDDKVFLRDPSPVGAGKAYAVPEETFLKYWQIPEKNYGLGVIITSDD